MWRNKKATQRWLDFIRATLILYKKNSLSPAAKLCVYVRFTGGNADPEGIMKLTKEDQATLHYFVYRIAEIERQYNQQALREAVDALPNRLLPEAYRLFFRESLHG